MPLMLRADRGDARALPHPLRLLGACRASSSSGCPSCCRSSTRTRRTVRSGRARRRTATRRTGCSSARTDRSPTYRAADVVYLVDKLERGFDRAIYVLGADHHGTRNWYAAVARMLGYDPERVEVLLYQLVHLTRGGEQTKMSKRRGDVVFLDEFMDEIGVDAARWYLVEPRPRPDDRDRRRPRGRAVAEEPRLLRPVRARPDRRDPPQRGDAAVVRRARRPARARGARSRQAARRVPGARRRGARDARPARDPDLRDPRRRRLPPLLPRAPRARERAGRRSGSASAARRRRSSRAASTSSASRRPSGCEVRRGGRRTAPDRNLALELVRVTEAARDGGRPLDRARREGERRPGGGRRDAVRARQRLDARRRRDRRGGEGRGADALQRRGGRERRGGGGRRRRRSARGDAADRARACRTRSRSSRSPSAGRCSSPAPPSTWRRSPSGPTRSDAIDIERSPAENVRRGREGERQDAARGRTSSCSTATGTTS